jgi:gluconokinase
MDRSTSSGQAVIGIDLGTSAVKVLAVTAAGREIALGSEFYGLETPQPDYVEQDADVVYGATMRVLRHVLGEVRLRGSDVAALGISSAMHGVVCVDGNGEPLSHAITWMDRRSADLVAGWRADGTAAALYRETGAPMHPMLPIAKIRWLAEHEPERFAKTARFVGLKELFVYRWTGEWLVDWGLAGPTGMFALETRAWSPRALDLARIDAARLSRPVPPSTVVPGFRAPIARELGVHGGDLAIVLASSDGALANIGSGAATGDLAVTLGTSGAARTLTTAPRLDNDGRTFCYPADDRRFVVGGSTSSAGAALDWTCALLLDELPKEKRFERAAALAAEIAPGANGCTALPFLAGERAPYWDPALRGAIAGLDLAHDRRTILRAAFEGVVFGVLAVYDVMRERTGAADRLLLSGGLTKAPLVRAMLADIFGIPAVEPHQPEASALGAALLAAQARGLVGDAATAARTFGYDAPTTPDPAHAAAYRDAYRRYRSAVDAALSARAG